MAAKAAKLLHPLHPFATSWMSTITTLSVGPMLQVVLGSELQRLLHIDLPARDVHLAARSPGRTADLPTCLLCALWKPASGLAELCCAGVAITAHTYMLTLLRAFLLPTPVPMPGFCCTHTEGLPCFHRTLAVAQGHGQAA